MIWAPGIAASHSGANCGLPGLGIPRGDERRLLRRPRAVGVRGHARHVDATGTHLHHEEHVHPPQGDRAVHMEEAAGEHRGGLGTRELPPRRAAATRGGRDPQPRQDPPHRGCTDLVPRPSSSPWIGLYP